MSQCRPYLQAAPYSTLKYTVIGTGNAPLYFTVGETTGDVRLRSALYADQSQNQYVVCVDISISVSFFICIFAMFLQ